MNGAEEEPDLVFATQHMEEIDLDDEKVVLASLGDLNLVYQSQVDAFWVENCFRVTPPADKIEVYDDEKCLVLENSIEIETYQFDDLLEDPYSDSSNGSRVDEKTDIVDDNMKAETGEWLGRSLY